MAADEKAQVKGDQAEGRADEAIGDLRPAKEKAKDAIKE